MKTTTAFKDTIKAYLDQRAAEDSLFVASYAKENKNLDDCCTYILNQVHESKCNGFTDDEIFGMAVHYYDEDKIEVGKPVSGVHVVTNHVIELTDEEREQVRQQAIKKVQDDAIAEMKKKSAKPKRKVETIEQPSLFD